MAGLKLYELPGQWRLIQAEIASTEGELSESLERDIELIQGTLEQKAEAICKIRAQLRAEADAAKRESQRLADMARSRERKAEWLVSYLKRTLEAMDIRSVSTPMYRITVCNNSRPSVTFTGDVEQLPTDWIVTTKHADTQKAYETWDAGEDVPDGFTITRGTHLRIT